MSETEKVDDFIGRRFGKDGHLEVIGRSANRLSGPLLYSIKCHSCSKDTELYGEGIFLSEKYSILRGCIPCGCSKNFKCSESQWDTKIRRRCAERGYEYLGYVGDKLKSSTKITLKCLRDGHIWSTMTPSRLNQGISCPKCYFDATALRLTDDACMIKGFISTGSFPDGATFNREYRKPYVWNYFCPICAEDAYSKAGLCTGNFKSSSGRLTRGALPCRCAKNYRWTQEQREHQISVFLSSKSNSINFVGWDGDYRKGSRVVVISCEIRGLWKIDVSALLKSKGCPKCATGGFDSTSHASYLYTILAENGGVSFAGYGITNHPEDRLKTHSRNLRRADFTVLTSNLFETSGQEAVDIEKNIKLLFHCTPQNIRGFAKEATCATNYKSIVDYIMSNQQVKLVDSYEKETYEK